MAKNESSEGVAYILVSGIYSDWEIYGVFLNRSDAVRVVNEWEHCLDYDLRIEERPLNPKIPTMNPDMGIYGVTLNEDGDTVHAFQLNTGWTYEDAFHIEPLRRSWSSLPGEPDVATLYLRGILARDKAHAVKIAAEHWRQIKALGPWGIVDIGENQEG